MGGEERTMGRPLFRESSCNRCGLCLSECPVLGVPRERAGEEMEKLVEGRETEVLSRCTSCMTCNLLCPAGCSPYHLILRRWEERYEREGLPLRVRTVLPLETPNFLSIARESMPEDERRMLSSWSEALKGGKGGGEILYAGCNAQIFPYLLRTRLLEGLTAVGEQSLCCGEIYYRMGLLGKMEGLPERVGRRLNSLRPKKLITFCPACYHMLRDIYPDFGVGLDFELQDLREWLWEGMEKGRIELRRKLDKRATIQDSCHAKLLGESFLDLPRKMVEAMGMEVVEMERSRRRAMCCGIAEGICSYNPFDIVEGAVRQLKEAERTGADLLVVYCATCLLILSIGKVVYPAGMPIFHVLELLQLATGEEPLRRNMQRAEDMIRGLGEKTVFSEERFWVGCEREGGKCATGA